MNLIVIGGNRLNEESPFKEILSLRDFKNIKITILTSKLNLNKPTGYNSNFKKFLKNKKIQFTEVFSNKNIFNELKKILKKEKNSYLLLIYCTFIIDKKIINLFKNKVFNYHVGLLPEQRGGAATTWQTMSGTKKSALTIHKVVPGIDKGDVILENKINIQQKDSLGKFYNKVVKLENNFFLKFIKIINKKLKIKKQNIKESIYMPRLDTEVHSFINWNWNGEEIHQFIKSFDTPFKGARTFIEGKKIILKSSKLEKKLNKFHPFQSGIIFRKYKNFYYIACKKYSIKVKFILDKDGKKINKKIIGKRLHTPNKFLEKALISKAIHLPKGITIK
tara:strand:+ start:312 stop:1313 length:1002 start_codon:yes stop_codon:yes gene_type:complete